MLLWFAPLVAITFWSLTIPLTATELFTVSGTVVDEETREPLKGARILITGAVEAISLTGENGSYKIFSKCGACTLKVLKENYEECEKPIMVKGPLIVNVALTPLVSPPPSPSPSKPPTITLTADSEYIYTGEGGKTTLITAVVKKSDGTPAVGVTINFECSGDLLGEFESQTAVTDDEGVATMTWTYTGKAFGEKDQHVNTWGAVTASTTVEDQSIKDKIYVTVAYLPCEDPSCHPGGTPAGTEA